MINDPETTQPTPDGQADEMEKAQEYAAEERENNGGYQ
jgi:hypothetical protein